MTASKAIEYLTFILKEHPRIESADFGSAMKLGQEALKRHKAQQADLALPEMHLLPGEDPE